jgi:hypothetical protein
MKWTTKEEKFLDRFYSETNIHVLSYEMGRSGDSIRRKAFRKCIRSTDRKSCLTSNGKKFRGQAKNLLG